MSVLLVSILLASISIVLGIQIPKNVLHVTNKNINVLKEDISKALLPKNGQAILFNGVNQVYLESILKDSNFPFYPTNDRRFFFIHSYFNKDNNRIYHSKEYFLGETVTSIYINNGTKLKSFKRPKEINPKKLMEFEKDINDYMHFCGDTSDVSKALDCKNYLKKWRFDQNFTDDQNGMVPTNKSACWGQLQQHTYLDLTKDTTFAASIPFNIWFYALANEATLQLDGFLLYVLADGLYSQTPACNTGGCRGYFHRKLDMNIWVYPQDDNNINDYFWVYSEPQTVNGKTSATTSVSDSFSIGTTAEISDGVDKVQFSMSYTHTSSYGQTVTISDFSTVENTNAATGEGIWSTYQTNPVNINNYPLSESNFNDWEAWYSSQWNPCTIVTGPQLAYASQQTSNAIKWEAKPVVFENAGGKFPVNYELTIHADVDTIWCDDWTGHPVNPCNQQSGGQHHCLSADNTGVKPMWKANLIQSMNNWG